MMKKKKNPHWDEERREKPQSIGYEKKKKQNRFGLWKQIALLSRHEVGVGIHNSTQSLIQFFREK